MGIAATSIPVRFAPPFGAARRLHSRRSAPSCSTDLYVRAVARPSCAKATKSLRLKATLPGGGLHSPPSSASSELKQRLWNPAPKTWKTTRRAAGDDDESASSSSSIDGIDESLECVVVGMEAACVVGEDQSGEAADRVSTATNATALEEEDSAGDASGALGVLGGLALISPFFLWGTSMVAMKEVLPATSPLFVASVRLVPAGAVLLAWAGLNGRPWPKGGMAWMAILLFGLVDGTAFQGCLSEGLQRTSAGLGSVIIDSQPITVAILASIIYGETLAPAGIGGLVLGIAGLLLLELPRDALIELANGDVQRAIASVTSGISSEGGLWDSGEWWMLLAAQSMAVGTVMVRWVCKYVDPVMATGWHMVLGGVPLLAYSISTEPDVYSNLGNLGANEVGGLLYTSLLGSALAYGEDFDLKMMSR